jgi:hypothetical protein
MSYQQTTIVETSPEGGISSATIESKFRTLIQELPEAYFDRLALMRIAEKLFAKLRLPSIFIKSDEVSHLFVQLIMSIFKVNIWTYASEKFAGSEYENLKVAAVFSGCIGLLPQLISLIRLKLSAHEKINTGHWLQRTIPAVSMATLVPLAFYQDSAWQQSADLPNALWQSARIAAAIAILEKATAVAVYDGTILIRNLYVGAKRVSRVCCPKKSLGPLAIDSETDPLLEDVDLYLSTAGRARALRDLPKNYTQEAMKVMRVLDQYNSLPYLFLFLLIAIFVLMGTNTATHDKVQTTFNGNSYGIGNLAAFSSFLVAAILCKVHAYLNP